MFSFDNIVSLEVDEVMDVGLGILECNLITDKLHQAKKINSSVLMGIIAVAVAELRTHHNKEVAEDAILKANKIGNAMAENIK